MNGNVQKMAVEVVVQTKTALEVVEGGMLYKQSRRRSAMSVSAQEKGTQEVHHERMALEEMVMVEVQRWKTAL